MLAAPATSIVLFEGGAGETVRRELLKQADVHTLLRPPFGRSTNARCASPLIFSRRSRRWLVVWAIDLAPIGADDDGVCVFGC
jgi:type I restriction enzyme M protein